MSSAKWPRLVCWVALLAFALTFSACRRRSHRVTVQNDGETFAVDEFPGAAVQNGNVADDGRAMSPAAESFSQVGCYQNGDRGVAMVVFFTEPTIPGDPRHLYASYFDGESWTPPVPLAAADGQPVQFKFGIDVVVAFLNTADHADLDARERDGDAIIAWIGVDADQDGAGTADGVNSGIYTTYFNSSDRDVPARNHGFQELGDRISTQDEESEGVFGVGIVSDGLCGEARGTTGEFAYRFGDSTSGISLVWVQQLSNDSLNPALEDTSMYAVAFDLGQDGDPESPLVPGAETKVPILGFGASDSGLDSEETQVSALFHVYNNFLLMRVASDDEPGADVIMINDPPLSLTGPMVSYGNPMVDDGDDITLQVVRFDPTTGAMSAPHSLANTPDSTDSFESDNQVIGAFQHEIYGDDEGLAQIIIFHAILLADADAVTDFGSGAMDGNLFATGVDLLTGVPTGSCIIDAEDPAIFDTVLPGAVDTRLSRNGDYIWVAWVEDDASGASDDLALRVAQFSTTRLAEDGSIPATIPQVSARFSQTVTLSTDIDGFDVQWIMFQAGLDYVCGAQSDPDVLNLFFEHSTATGDAVHHARLTASHEVPVTPGVGVMVFESFEEGEMGLSGFDQPGEGRKFAATDAGAGGEALCAYRRDIDGTAASDFRAFAKKTGAGSPAVEIDSSAPEKQVVPASIRLIGTPAGQEIGVLDPVSGEDSPARTHAWSRVHVIFRESNTSENSGQGFALRTRVYLADGDPSTPPGDRFYPSAGTAFSLPTEISLPLGDPDPDLDAEIRGLAASGDTAAVYFTEQGHIYYQEYSDSRREEGESGWLESDGVSDPALVDDDSVVELEVPFPRMDVYAPACGCETLHGAIIVWVKVLDAAGNHPRLQVRVREED